jgi:hypothetical protein
MSELGNHYEFLLKNSERKDHLVNLDKDKNIILKWILGEYGVDWTQNGSEEAPSVNFIERNNKPSVLYE